MDSFGSDKLSAVNDFRQAHRQAALQQVLARVTGKSVSLLSYEDVLHKLKLTGRSVRGVRDIPIEAIIGTVGRCTDFTRTFLPRKASDEQRWADLKTYVQQHSLEALPPIEVYQIGTAYFVQDGHHRVSIARQSGAQFITAYVTEVHTRAPLTPDVDWEALIRNAEYADFLEYTHLDRLRPKTALSVSVPGQYAKLEDHIEVHRYFIEVAEERELDFEEAVCRWHDEAYQPIAVAIHEQGLLRDFPQRTAADLYLWIAEQRLVLQHELGWTISAEAATASLAEKFSTRSRSLLDRAGRAMLGAVVPASLKAGPAAGQWRKTKLAARYSARLFADILVPISDAPPGWAVLEQALQVACQEGSRVHGLHIVASEAELDSPVLEALRQEFERRCTAANVEGSFNLEVGVLADKVRELAALIDLVVIGLGPLGRSLSTEVRAWMRHCTRPVLAVPLTLSAFQHALLAYDGSPKSKEALFVAAYLGERWHTRLTVITVNDPGHRDDAELKYVGQYLELHELAADFVQASGSAP
ncbi:MAG TPA: universal stress protein, partial [Anaerolineae bacterium]|nr:universal stress protein [Anaerolineae bacterium]